MNSGDARRLGEEAARRLALTGQHEIGPGLTGAEFARIERDYGFEFADDHRAFLAAGLPLKTPEPYERRNPWPDWRDGDPGDLRKMLDWPVEGALFDVQYDDLWHPSWGQRPADMSTALSAARRHLARAPKMIPVWGHRYLPAGRGTYGYPVLSIWQTDIIIYGTDLANYIASEFFRRPSVIRDWTPPPPDRTAPPMVPFWSDFLLEDLRKPGRRSPGLPGSLGLEPADLAGARTCRVVSCRPCDNFLRLQGRAFGTQGGHPEEDRPALPSPLLRHAADPQRRERQAGTARARPLHAHNHAQHVRRGVAGHRPADPIHR